METSKILAITSFGSSGDHKLTLKEIPIRLHNKIINLFGDYQELYNASRDIEHELYPDAEEAYQELLGIADVKVFGIIVKENE